MHTHIYTYTVYTAHTRARAHTQIVYIYIYIYAMPQDYQTDFREHIFFFQQQGPPAGQLPQPGIPSPAAGLCACVCVIPVMY